MEGMLQIVGDSSGGCQSGYVFVPLYHAGESLKDEVNCTMSARQRFEFASCISQS